MADVAVPERQVVATQHLGSAAPASAGQARVRPGLHLGPADRRAVDRGIERVLDRDVPTREDVWERPSRLLQVSVADRCVGDRDGLAGCPLSEEAALAERLHRVLCS